MGETSLAQQTLIVDWTFTAIAILAVALLFVQRHVNHLRIGLDDFVVVFALAMGLVLVCQTTWAIRHESQAEHQQDVPVSDLYRAATSLMVNEALWSIATASIRISIGLFYRRIFVAHKIRIILTSTFIIPSTCHGIASVLEVFLICQPIAANWDYTLSGQCGNVLVSYTVIECIGLGLDLLAVVIPTPALLNLKMSKPRKVQIIVLFDIGLLVLVITGLRLHALRLTISLDFIWSESYLGMLSAVGCMAAAIFAALPVVVPMIANLLRFGTLKRPEQQRPTQNAIIGNEEAGYSRSDMRDQQRSIIDSGAPSSFRQYLPKRETESDEEHGYDIESRDSSFILVPEAVHIPCDCVTDSTTSIETADSASSVRCSESTAGTRDLDSPTPAVDYSAIFRNSIWRE